MTGSVNIIVPNLGESVTQAVVTKWLKKVGDFLSQDETILELETEKVSVEVNASHAGQLTALKFAVGSTVKVGDIVATVDSDAVRSNNASLNNPPVTTPQATTPQATTSQVTTSQVTTSQSNAILANAIQSNTTALDIATSSPASLGAQSVNIAASSSESKIFQKPAQAAATPQSTPQTPATQQVTEKTSNARDKLSPAVRKLVVEKSIDPHTVPGSGKAGRILKEDILKNDNSLDDVLKISGLNDIAHHDPLTQNNPAPQQSSLSNQRNQDRVMASSHDPVHQDEQRLPMSQLRKTIARRLKEAQNSAALLTTFNEVDMAALIQKRQLYKDSFEKKHHVKLGYMSFFVKAAIVALQEFPALNASIDQGDIIYKNHYDIGIAVATPNGLVVPVVKGADHLDFAAIEKKIAELADKGRNTTLSLDEISGGTFTITNGGVFGSLLSTPIINPPQSAILGLHKIQERPVAIDGQVVIRPMMYLALTYDHRLIDGKEAVSFLLRVKECIEDPERILLAV